MKTKKSRLIQSFDSNFWQLWNKTYKFEWKQIFYFQKMMSNLSSFFSWETMTKIFLMCPFYVSIGSIKITLLAQNGWYSNQTLAGPLNLYVDVGREEFLFAWRHCPSQFAPSRNQWFVILKHCY